MTTARTIALAPTLAAFLLIAWSRDLSQLAASFDLGLLLILALLALPLFAILIDTTNPAEPGTAQTIRLTLQKLLAQLPLAFAALTAGLAAGSFNLFTISMQQSTGIHHWLAFHDPFNLVAFCLTVIVVHGVLKSRPAMEAPCRDAATSLAPPHVPFANAAVFLMGAWQTSVWLGAWYDPFGVVAHLETISHDSGVGPAVTAPSIAVAANALGLLVFFTKASLLLAFQKALARNLPHYGRGELFSLVFKTLLPVSLFNFVSAATYLWLSEPLLKFQNITQIVLATLGIGVPLVVVLGRFCGRLLAKRTS